MTSTTDKSNSLACNHWTILRLEYGQCLNRVTCETAKRGVVEGTRRENREACPLYNGPRANLSLRYFGLPLLCIWFLLSFNHSRFDTEKSSYSLEHRPANDSVQGQDTTRVNTSPTRFLWNYSLLLCACTPHAHGVLNSSANDISSNGEVTVNAPFLLAWP